MATAPPPIQNGAIAEGAGAIAFLSFVTLFLLAGAAVSGALTVQGILGGVEIPARTVAFSIASVVSLGFALLFGLLAFTFG